MDIKIEGNTIVVGGFDKDPIDKLSKLECYGAGAYYALMGIKRLVEEAETARDNMSWPYHGNILDNLIKGIKDNIANYNFTEIK